MQLWSGPTRRRFQSGEMSPQSHIAAVILAAGESSRLGQPKQLIQFRGKNLVRRVVDAASEAGCQPILVVVSRSKRTPHLHSLRSPREERRQHELDLVQGICSELKKTGATIVANPNCESELRFAQASST